MPSPPAIRPPGIFTGQVQTAPETSGTSGSYLVAPEPVPAARAAPSAPDAPGQESAAGRTAVLEQVASTAGQVTSLLPPAASVVRTAYTTPHEQKPAPPGPRGETARRAQQARVAPDQNFGSSLTRALGVFFQWVAGLTEADPDNQPDDGSRPSTPIGSRVDTRV